MATSQASTGILFKTILFATDFTPSSEAAFPYVLSLGRCYGSKIIVAHAVPPDPLSGMSAVPPPDELDVEWQVAKHGMLKYQESRDFEGLRHEFVVERGDPLRIVSDLIAHEGVDLVVLGTHGRKGFHKLFAGSVAEKIFRKATCPVLTVGPGSEARPPESWKPARILLATDFSAGSLHALPFAILLAEENQAELILLHVAALVPWEQQAEMGRHYQHLLEELVPQDPPPNCRINFAVRFDLPASGILEMAKDKQADLIVIGVHRTPVPAIDSHMPWTTTCDVIGSAHCPVLTVRA